jgi:hypothetical protein
LYKLGNKSFFDGFYQCLHPVSDPDPDPKPRVTDPDLVKNFVSLRIRIHNTEGQDPYPTKKGPYPTEGRRKITQKIIFGFEAKRLK